MLFFCLLFSKKVKWFSVMPLNAYKVIYVDGADLNQSSHFKREHNADFMLLVLSLDCAAMSTYQSLYFSFPCPTNRSIRGSHRCSEEKEILHEDLVKTIHISWIDFPIGGIHTNWDLLSSPDAIKWQMMVICGGTCGIKWVKANHVSLKCQLLNNQLRGPCVQIKFSVLFLKFVSGFLFVCVSVRLSARTSVCAWEFSVQHA